MSVITMDAAAERVRWEAAYRAAFPRAYRGLVAMGARPEEAEDALHDAFVKGLERGGADRITTIDGWVFIVALRAWRRRRMRDRVLLPWTLFARAASPAPDPSAVETLSAIRALPHRQRQVVVARYVLGLSQEETAELLGIARGTVSATTTQAASALRQRLEDPR